jgi:type I restriction enzyme S subunit
VKNAQPKLALARIASLKLPVPNIDEQEEIVAMIDAIARKQQLHRRKHGTLSDLFATLLHKLMSAQIRVNDLDLQEFEKTAV